MRLGALLAAMGLLFVTTQAMAEIYRCEGTVQWQGVNKWNNVGVQVRLDIVMPEKTDSTVTLSSTRGRLNVVPVGIGKLEVIESTGQFTGDLQKYDLLVTRLSASYQIHGFVVTPGNLVHVLRVDLNEKGKPFSYFDSSLNNLVTGSCE